MKSAMMVHMQMCVFILILVLAAVSASSQEPIYEPTWESIIENYSIPQWYEDGKFGIYVHWGVFQVPARYCLYGDEMYDENHPSFTYHRQTYGDQKTFGYKDFIPLYTMEKFDPEAWADLFVESGAKYIMPIAIFHDGVAQYKSNVIKKFNLVDYPGACGKDVVALLEKSVRARGLKFGITNQYLENWGYYCHSPDYDTSDLENVELYNTGEGGVCGRYFYTGYNGAVARKSWLEGMWLASVYEQIDMFKPDIIFFDMATQLGFDHLFDGQNLKTALTAYYYNAALKWGKQVAINMKVNSMPMGTHVHDHERGSLSTLQPLFWQSDTPLGNGWGYRAPYTCRKPANMMRLLAESVALNGSVMMATGNLPDGTLPPGIPTMLREIGNWLKTNGEAIYHTRPWKVQKEGPTTKVGQAGTNYTTRDIRFTADKAWTKIYAIGLDWPGSQMIITSMKTGSFDVSTIDSIYLIGGGKLTYSQDDAGLKVNVGERAPIEDYPYAVKICLKTSERDAFAKIEAESCSNKRMGAIEVKTCSEGGQCLDGARSNDWAVYPKVNFGSGANEFEARVSASTVANSDIASIEVRLDDPSGPLIGTLTGACPGGINNYTTLTCRLTTTATGIHDLYLVFNPGFRSYNLNWFSFRPGTVPVSTLTGAHALVKAK